MDNEAFERCEVCGQPGQPSWGMTLCESCNGAAGATCAGIRMEKEEPSLPEVC